MFEGTAPFKPQLRIFAIRAQGDFSAFFVADKTQSFGRQVFGGIFEFRQIGGLRVEGITAK